MKDIDIFRLWATHVEENNNSGKVTYLQNCCLKNAFIAKEGKMFFFLYLSKFPF